MPRTFVRPLPLVESVVSERDGESDERLRDGPPGDHGHADVLTSPERTRTAACPRSAEAPSTRASGRGPSSSPSPATRAWYGSPAYQEIPPRTGHIGGAATLVEGIEPGHEAARLAAGREAARPWRRVTP
ncbi:hypothetical protein ACQEUU_14585 [Nonomuraea sp. CA-218870]|uniref:hypothetical protein n=1 Tax=Nonomuraea sp. CA-218870 TaxID=3239998 RepID=UPI003D9300E1